MNGLPTSSRRVVKPGVKRRRPPLACIQCYQRKLKCGRELPSCSRCAKTGYAGVCTYRGDSILSSLRDGTISDGCREGPDVATSLRSPVSPIEAPERQMVAADLGGNMTHLEGHGTITKFYGYSYPLNFYQQFTELRSHIIQIKTKNPAINSLRDEIYSLPKVEYQRGPLANDATLDDTLRQLIPIKPITDTLVQTYIDRFEIIHRVLNTSAFISGYNRYWANPLGTPTYFLVQLLLVAAAAASFHPAICIDMVSQKTVHDHALSWVEAAEAWLDLSANQPPRSWDILASHCLLLVAKRANYIQEGSFWTYTGALVRWAMAAGYHREATSTFRISLYYREMRRRLWTTIVELDLQASIERGMPTSIRKEDFNIISPLNIDDDRLQESMQDPPHGMPLTTLTKTSFQVLMYRSLPIRLRVCAFVNGCCEQDDFDQVLKLEGELGKALQDRPEWDDPGADPRQQQTAKYVQNLLGIFLNQYTLLLHIQLAIQTPPSIKSAICRRARLEAAMKLLRHHQTLLYDETLPEQTCRTGLVLAAVNICHEIYLDVGPHASDHSPTVAIFPEVSIIFLTIVEEVLQILEKRISLKFNGLNEYYILSMIIALIKSKLWPESSLKSDKEAADRVIRVCTILQTRQASIRRHNSILEPVDNARLRELDLSDDLSSMIPDSVSELFGSMLPQDLGYINNNLDIAFFHT